MYSETTMKITVRYLTLHRELVGKSYEEFELVENSTLGDLVAQLILIYPSLEESRDETTISLNGMLADRDTVLSDGDIVAFFPIVTGG